MKAISTRLLCGSAWLFLAAIACAQAVKPVTPSGTADAPSSAAAPASAAAATAAPTSAPVSTTAPAPGIIDQAAAGQAGTVPAKSKAARGTSSAQQEAGEPRAATSATPSTGARTRKNATDHVELDTTTVTGNRELPKVMYVVPWKHSDIGDLIGRPANSLLDEVLAPVDRSVFRREVQYYQALKPDTAGGGGAAAAPGPASSGAAAAPAEGGGSGKAVPERGGAVPTAPEPAVPRPAAPQGEK